MSSRKVDLKSIEKAYRRYARYYDFIFGEIFHPGRKTAVEHLHCQPGDRILEVGVGTGLSLGLYPKATHIVGIDLSSDMLKKAKEKVKKDKLENVESLECMDAQAMTFPDNSFEKVIAMYVASVVPDPVKLVCEIERVCKPGGLIVFLNHFQSVKFPFRQVESMLTPLAKYIGFHPEFKMDDFLEKTKFEVSNAIPVNLFDYWTILIGNNQKNLVSTKK